VYNSYVQNANQDHTHYIDNQRLVNLSVLHLSPYDVGQHKRSVLALLLGSRTMVRLWSCIFRHYSNSCWWHMSHPTHNMQRWWPFRWRNMDPEMRCRSQSQVEP